MDDIAIGTFDPPFARRVADATRKVERMLDSNPTDRIFNLPAPIVFRNDSGFSIPAYGCCQVTGTAELGSQNYLLVGRPIAWTAALVGPFFFNGPYTVAVGEYGNFQPGPVYRAIGDGTSLTVGMRIGPTASAFTVGKGCLYSVLGADDLAANCLRLVDNHTPILGTTNAAIAAGASGLVTVRVPSATTWSAGSVTYTAWNDSTTTIAISKRVLLFPVDAKWVAVEVC